MILKRRAMTIAVALKKFVDENRSEIFLELQELVENTGGNAFSLLASDLNYLCSIETEKLNDSEVMSHDGRLLLYKLFAGLSGITVHFPPGSTLRQMLQVEGTLDVTHFQSFLKRYLRWKTAYSFETAGQQPDLSVVVRDKGVTFIRSEWSDILRAPNALAEYFVAVDCTGEAGTLGEIVEAFDRCITTAVAAFMASYVTAEGWTPVVSEQAQEARAAYGLVEKWMAELPSEARELLLKYPKTLEVFAELQQKTVV